MRTETRKRAGSIPLEILLTLPVLLVVILAAIQFGLMISVNNRLAVASAQGARAASQGAGMEEVEKAVRDSLGEGRLGEKAEVHVRLTDKQLRPLASGEPVEVIVTVKTTSVVPDMLKFIGYSMKDEELIGRTAMRKE